MEDDDDDDDDDEDDDNNGNGNYGDEDGDDKEEEDEGAGGLKNYFLLLDNCGKGRKGGKKEKKIINSLGKLKLN